MNIEEAGKMNDSNENDTSFVEQLRERTKRKVEEYYSLLHEEERIKVQRERTKIYVDQANSLLEGEGQTPIVLKEPKQGTGAGKIGNRAKGFPVRRAEWNGKTLDEIIKVIVEANPNENYYVDVIAHKVYEIQSDVDVRRVKQSLVSILKKGAQRGLWVSLPKNRYKAKASARIQPKLVN